MKSKTAEVLEKIIKIWKESEEYAKFCLLNIMQYEKTFKDFDFLIECGIKRVNILFLNDKMYTVDIYADAMYLCFDESEIEIQLLSLYSLKIHVVSNTDKFAAFLTLPLAYYDIQVDLSKVNKTTSITLYNVKELKKVFNPNYGFSCIDLYLNIDEKKDVLESLDKILKLRYLYPDVVGYSKVNFNILCSDVNVRGFKSFITHLKEYSERYMKDSLQNKILLKNDIKEVRATCYWNFNNTWFQRSVNVSWDKSVLIIEPEILNLLAPIQNKYGVIGIIDIIKG